MGDSWKVENNLLRMTEEEATPEKLSRDENENENHEMPDERVCQKSP